MFPLILAQTITLAFRKGGGALGGMAFYVIIVTLFTFALGPEGIEAYAGAVMCVALLLSAVTMLPLFYERDDEDGTLEQYLLQPTLLEALVLAKICGQWAAGAAPMLAVSPLLAIMAGLSAEHTLDTLLLLLLVTPTLIAVGSVAAALTLGARRGGLLQAIIVLPLYVPLLIPAAIGGDGAILALAALLCASLPLSCWASAALIRVSQE
ncbi:MAG: heme exporter protein CcmB [Pseudomonadota bacterium]|nr:heme exporter protein CcmB [Pseudomonadota bacterium]MDE3038134.1 heme exporter protein CcmB [Pseudomonadota bacterium]